MSSGHILSPSQNELIKQYDLCRASLSSCSTCNLAKIDMVERHHPQIDMGDVFSRMLYDSLPKLK